MTTENCMFCGSELVFEMTDKDPLGMRTTCSCPEMEGCVIGRSSGPIRDGSLLEANLILENHGRPLREGDIVYAAGYDCDLIDWCETEDLGGGLVGVKDTYGNWLCFGHQSTIRDILP